ncbi:MAG: NfeD family protein [candidate division Zixibacteria bacterium]|nr:NfeD family protein [candidate division Zixibacteria bacterium]
MSTTFWIWMAAAVVFLILELMSPSLFFICFVVGGIAAGILSYFSPDAYYWQIGLFIVVTLGLLPLTRSIAKKITKPAPQKSNVDALIGQIALVTKEIDPDLGGQVLIGGETWKALAEQRVEQDRKVKVISVTGVHVKVEPVDQ